MVRQSDVNEMLAERARRLMNEHFENAGLQVSLTVAWISRQPVLTGLLAEAQEFEPGCASEENIDRVLSSMQSLRWPTRTEEGQSALIWAIMQKIRADEAVHDDAGLYVLGSGRSAIDGWREFFQRVLLPMFSYLLERTHQEGSILHTFERYVHLLEWFNRPDLYQRYEARRSTGEEVYNDDLQKFLYQDADYLTHAKVRSASGEADITGATGAVDPLICEGKIFDSRGTSYLASGVHQVVRYAHDYRKNVAYLVVFNMTDKQISFADGISEEWPPRLEVAGVRVNLIVIRAKPPAVTASKAGRASVLTINKGDLIAGISDDK